MCAGYLDVGAYLVDLVRCGCVWWVGFGLLGIWWFWVARNMVVGFLDRFVCGVGVIGFYGRGGYVVLAVFLGGVLGWLSGVLLGWGGCGLIWLVICVRMFYLFLSCARLLLVGSELVLRVRI